MTQRNRRAAWITTGVAFSFLGASGVAAAHGTDPFVGTWQYDAAHSPSAGGRVCERHSAATGCAHRHPHGPPRRTSRRDQHGDRLQGRQDVDRHGTRRDGRQPRLVGRHRLDASEVTRGAAGRPGAGRRSP